MLRVHGVPPPVMDAIDRLSAPLRGAARSSWAALVFDVATIARTMAAVATAAHGAGIRALFAAKSFPHPHILALAAELLDGFDVASVAELAAVAADKIVSVADPSGAAVAHARGARAIAVCETVDQVRAAPPGADIAIRVSASITGTDPAIGAVLDGTGRRRSRFGLDDRAAIAAMVDAAAGRRVGLHVHHGAVVAAAASRFVTTARAALALVDVAPAFLDLGGSWQGIADLPGAFAELRAAVPAGIELLVEPGRLYTRDAGFACGPILAARDLGDRALRVVGLSRICHLRWSHVELVHRAPHPGRGRTVLVVGPTCFEDDVVGEWVCDPADVEPGMRVVVRSVTGYAVAWNTGFGGVPPADVVLAT
jgi:diaminopimelate decarboxylase